MFEDRVAKFMCRSKPLNGKRAVCAYHCTRLRAAHVGPKQTLQGAEYYVDVQPCQRIENIYSLACGRQTGPYVKNPQNSLGFSRPP